MIQFALIYPTIFVSPRQAQYYIPRHLKSFTIRLKSNHGRYPARLTKVGIIASSGCSCGFVTVELFAIPLHMAFCLCVSKKRRLDGPREAKVLGFFSHYLDL